MSLKRSLLLSLILFATIPTIIVSAVTMGISIRNTEQEILNNVNNLCVSNGNALNELIDSFIRELTLASQKYTVIKFLEKTSTSDGTIKYTGSQDVADDVTDYLSYWIGVNPHYDDAVIVDKNGIVIKAYNPINIGKDLSDENYITESLNSKSTFFSNALMSISSGEVETIAISHSISDSEDNVLGSVVLYTKVDFFKNYVDAIHFGKEGVAMIIDSVGRVLYHPEAKYIGIINEQSPILPILEDLRHGLGERTGQFYSVFDGRERAMSYYNLQNISWTLVLSIPVSEISEARRTLFITLFSSLAVSMTASVFLGFLLSRSVTSKLTKLSDAFSLAAWGKKYVPCHIEDKSEIGRLAHDYNEMVGIINAAYEKNEFLAHTDLITGLSNRTVFESKTQDLLHEKVHFGIILVDLDDFRIINDVYGHAFGDAVLSEFAKKISESANADLISRIGGDEFYLIKIGNKDAADIIAQQITDAMEKPLTVRGKHVFLTVSVGIAMYPDDARDMDSLIKYADMAMYDAKSIGKNRISFFDEKMKAQINRQNQIGEVLRSCVEEKEVFAVFQPEVGIKENKVLLFEVLMRINSKKLGFISPAEFIPVAESSGFIIKLGKYIFEQSCYFVKSLIEKGFDIKAISINISAMELLEVNFVENILEIIRNVGISPRYIQIEITESVMMKNLELNTKKLNALREHGFTVALDDFGTSYSSLNHLINLPIDVLKIDKSFIDEISENNKKQTVAQLIISMAHEMGMKVVAEGIEDQKQVDTLRQMNCDMIQGYYYSKPVPADLAVKLLEDWK